MGAFVDMMREGGPVMFVLLGGTFWGGLLGLIRLALSGRARFVGLGAATLLGTLCLGLAGTFHGFIQVFEALAFASAEVKEELFHYGMDIAQVPGKAAIVCAGLLAPLHLISVIRESASPPKALRLVAIGAAGLLGFLTLVDLGLLAATFQAMGDATANLTGDAPGGAERAMHMALKLSRLMNAGLAVAALGFLLSFFVGVVSLIAGGMSLASKPEQAA